MNNMDRQNNGLQIVIKSITDNLIWLWLCVMFIAVNVIFIPFIKDSFWFPKQYVYLMFGFILIGLSYIQTSLKSICFKNKWIGFMIIYVTLSFCYFALTNILLFRQGIRIVWNVWNFLPTINFLLGLFLIQTFVEYTDSKLRWVSIAEFICYFTAIYSCYGIMQYFKLDQIFNFSGFKWVHTNHLHGFLGNSMLMANLLAIISPLYLMFKQLRFKIMYAIVILTIILADSTTSLLAVGFTLFVYFLIVSKHRKLIGIAGSLLSIISLTLIVIFKPSLLDLGERIWIWRQTLPLIKTNFLTGCGIGSFAMNQFTDPANNSLAVQAHCEPIQILNEGGFILFVFVFGYLATLFIRIMEVLRNNASYVFIAYVLGLISFIIISLPGFPLRIAPLALMGIIIISAIESLIVIESTKQVS